MSRKFFLRHVTITMHRSLVLVVFVLAATAAADPGALFSAVRPTPPLLGCGEEGSIRPIKGASARASMRAMMINPRLTHRTLVRACPVQVAADDASSLEKALDRYPDAINTPGPGGQTPLMNAVLSGKLNAVKVLLGRGADTKIGEQDGYTPMHGAGFQVCPARAVRTLRPPLPRLHTSGPDPSLPLPPSHSCRCLPRLLARSRSLFSGPRGDCARASERGQDGRQRPSPGWAYADRTVRACAPLPPLIGAGRALSYLDLTGKCRVIWQSMLG